MIQEAPIQSDRLLLTAKDGATALGISRAQFWKLHAMGKLPLPVRPTARCPRWRADELRAWVKAGCPDRQSWERMRGAIA